LEEKEAGRKIAEDRNAEQGGGTRAEEERDQSKNAVASLPPMKEA